LIRRLFGPLFAASCQLVACGSSQDAVAQQSAGRIARAIEVVRDAPNTGKALALGALAKAACVGPDVCETKGACQSAYALHVEATNLTQAAKLKLGQGDAAEAAKLLGASERKLSEASPKVEACLEREAALRRRYKL
jgi:hypothetical protein